MKFSFSSTPRSNVPPSVLANALTLSQTRLLSVVAQLFRFVISVVIVLGPESFDGLDKRFFDDCHSASLLHHYHITIIHTIM